ncbi:MAG: peptidase M3 [Planctomycetaceae bacterium]|nr:peptidase M3 [Planctomycetaceae bacterium]
MAHADQAAGLARAALAEARDRLERFAASAGAGRFDEVAAEFDAITRPLDGIADRIGLYLHVHPDAAVRDAARECQREIEAFVSEFGLHRGAYARLAALDPAESQDPLAQRLVKRALREFRRSGVDRDERTREEIRSLREQLVAIGQAFEENIVTGGRSFRIEEGHRGLLGLPEDFLRSHPEEQDGSVTLGTDSADRVPMLMFAERDDLRAAYFVICQNRAVPVNLDVLVQMIAKRHQLAALLGYRSYADYVTEDKMSGSAAGARDFVERVIERVRPRALAEVEELLEWKQRHCEETGRPYRPWLEEHERLFLTEKLKAERYRVDAREVRPYCSFESVKRGVIATAEALYGVRIVRCPDVDTWHPSVETYELFAQDGARLARFYLDLFPRSDKYTHAAMFSLGAGVAGHSLPEAALVCNFPEPKDGDPGLMLFDEVTTFFHEFGHLLHHLFAGSQRYLAFSGIACEMDFVEVPSQLFEEWAWDSGVLASFARHHQTGEPIPAELVNRMRAAEEYGKGLHVLVQMHYALLSLEYFDGDLKGRDVTQIAIDAKRRLLPMPHTEGSYFHAAFGHLEGYSAMYYTYMWSLAIAKDVLGRFEGRLMDTSVANAWRETVLAPGGSADATAMVSAFLGRGSDLDAFERWLAK